MSFTTIGWVLAGMGLVALSGGCVSPVTLSDEFGTSIEEAKRAQRRAIEARVGPDSVDGLAGRAAERAVERYFHSFSLQPAAPAPALSGEGAVANPDAMAQ